NDRGAPAGGDESRDAALPPVRRRTSGCCGSASGFAQRLSRPSSGRAQREDEDFLRCRAESHWAAASVGGESAASGLVSRHEAASFGFVFAAEGRILWQAGRTSGDERSIRIVDRSTRAGVDVAEPHGRLVLRDFTGHEYGKSTRRGISVGKQFVVDGNFGYGRLARGHFSVCGAEGLGALAGGVRAVQ